jgi:hypothetical protein
MGVVVKHR